MTSLHASESRTTANTRLQSATNKWFHPKALVRFIGTLLHPSAGTTSLGPTGQSPDVALYSEAYEYFVQGEALRQQETPEAITEAIRFYERALMVHPEFFDAMIGLGKAHRRKGDLKRALWAYQKALALNELSSEANIELAKTLHEAGFLDKAIHHFRIGCKANPENIEAKFNLALCLELNDDMLPAAGVYRDILEADAGFAPAYNNLGSILMRQGQYQQALVLFEELMKLLPGFSRAYLGMAICLDRLSQHKEALYYYEQLLLGKFHTRNREFLESRIRTIRRMLGLTQNFTSAGSPLVRVK